MTNTSATHQPGAKPVGSERILSPEEIADALGRPRPTAEQSAIISSDLVPRLVVAGAGSGKTATMVDRVVWLVANKKVRADQVLGVTFTRKAAGELRERMRIRLEQLRRKNLVTFSESEGIVDPEVSTYHSYANSLVKNYGLRLGIEQDAQLLGAAQSWQLAAQLVERLDPRMLPENPPAKSTIIEGMLTLAGECAEHLRSPLEVIDFCAESIAVLESLDKPGARKTRDDTVRRLEQKQLFAELAQRYSQLKRSMQVMDYGDLMAHAAQIARSIPVAQETEQDRYRVVLLDEFQDTSHAQMRLFSDLFGAGSGTSGHPVMAVGDPKQSIYGFRGASDGQLFSFYDYFPAEDTTASYLTVAWRNDTAILDAANTVARPLADPAPWSRSSTRVSVPDLVARPHAGEGKVELGRYLTDTDEARALAERVASERAPFVGRAQEMPTMAVLCKQRTAMEPVRQAFEELGVPYQVVGLGGLLDTPEIVDLVAYLRVLSDPGRSDALMRILSGARWRLGLSDLLAFGDWAAHLARVRLLEIQMGITEDVNLLYHSPAEPGEQSLRSASSPDELKRRSGTKATEGGAEDSQAEIRARLESMTKRAESDMSDGASLIEALETLPQEGWTSYQQRSISPTGLARLKAVRNELAYLREFMADDLGVLITEIERTILLDIELAVKPGTSSHSARKNIDAFQDVAAQFALSAPRLAVSITANESGQSSTAEEGMRFSLSTGSGSTTGVSAFLAWLDSAASHESGLEMAAEEPRKDAVQILTVHASKGLEWDQVYIPMFNEGDFPKLDDPRWTQHAATLPWPLRGDHRYLPAWQKGAQDFKEFDELMGIFKEEAAEHRVAEERRLAYVGMTRARSYLMLTSSAWKASAVKAREESRFLQELGESNNPAPGERVGAPQVIAQLKAEETGENNPQSATILAALWPFDPIDGPTISSWQSLEELNAATPAQLTARAPGKTQPSRRAHLRRAAQNVLRGHLLEEETHEPAVLMQNLAEGPNPQDWVEESQLLLGLLNQPTVQEQLSLPQHLSASEMVSLAQNAERVITNWQRPMPQRPGIAARKGDLFHTWVETHFEQTGMFDFDDESFADDDALEPYDLENLKENFLASKWATQTPWQVEFPIETPVDGVTLRGRIDAIFRYDDAAIQAGHSRSRWELVDWKTGKVPTGRDLKNKEVQLAIYRLAFSRLQGVALEDISASFFYATSGTVVTPEHLADEKQLVGLIRRARKLAASRQ